MAIPSFIPYRLRTLSGEAFVIGCAAVGGALFALLDVPAAWLSGSMLLVSVLGVTMRLPDLRKPWFDSTMIMSGTLIGSSATPEALAATARYPGSLLVLLVGMIAIMLATGAYLRYVARWSWIDALLAAAPGALSTVIAVAQAKGANIGRIAVIQLFRILVLVAILPSIMKLTGDMAVVPQAAVPIASIGDAALVLGAGLVTGLIFERIGITAPFILGATLSSSILHGTGTVHGTLPPEIATVIMVMLGAAMGGRVSNLKRGEIAGLFPLAIGGFVVSLVVAFAFAWPAAWLAGVPYANAMAAFAPGGLEAMAMLAFAMGLDPLYVGAHHLTRFMILGLAMPFLVVRFKNEPPKD
ncbi:AbrB family transcriptional regulator [Bosea caraganae]|uniref:AbrB family transcriptional regulator n=1 Tax=Bosea caraganae TaxID=2763117 RepID=A0A370KZR4_9HYPH|nr:AbrB family transcriptional regulator [Bosea caraganae]RDJ20481.1 AbrB family transcriptional regulator [Bosea caraganae]RDJ29996.1 AbrB family transcriptional regulator [Bosea caraganae]